MREEVAEVEVAGGVEELDPRVLRVHRDAAVVPPLARREFRAFVADVAERGIRVPLEATATGVVLDGRQRLLAALQLDLAAVPVRRVAPPDELDYMLRAAIVRRDLTPSQRAALAIELAEHQSRRGQARQRQLANLRQNTGVAVLPPRGKSRDHAAALAGVSARTVQDASTVREHDPALFERLKAGDVHASYAARQVRRRLRDERLPQPGALPEAPFELIYADPPWRFGNPDAEYAPEQHYPTMPLEQIAELAVPSAADAVLFLWAVNSLLPEALQVMAAWGFTYKAQLVWVKPSIKLGNYFRNRHELLLFGRKGNYPMPAPEERVDSVIEAHCGRHSQKPTVVYDLIEQSYPATTKLELFRRGNPHPGWAAWGNEVTT